MSVPSLRRPGWPLWPETFGFIAVLLLAAFVALAVSNPATWAVFAFASLTTTQLFAAYMLSAMAAGLLVGGVMHLIRRTATWKQAKGLWASFSAKLAANTQAQWAAGITFAVTAAVMAVLWQFVTNPATWLAGAKLGGGVFVGLSSAIIGVALGALVALAVILTVTAAVTALTLRFVGEQSDASATEKPKQNDSKEEPSPDSRRNGLDIANKQQPKPKTPPLPNQDPGVEPNGMNVQTPVDSELQFHTPKPNRFQVQPDGMNVQTPETGELFQTPVQPHFNAMAAGMNVSTPVTPGIQSTVHGSLFGQSPTSSVPDYMRVETPNASLLDPDAETSDVEEDEQQIVDSALN